MSKMKSNALAMLAMNEHEINMGKKQMGATYKQIKSIEDSFSCGSNLANYLSIELVELKKRYNTLADNQEQIDPNTPKFRFKI